MVAGPAVLLTCPNCSTLDWVMLIAPAEAFTVPPIMNDCCTVTDVEVPDAVMLPDDDTVVVFTVIVPGELWVVEPPPSIVVEVMLRTPDPTLRVTVAAEMVVLEGR
jgi:hypothetical protein